MQIVSQYKVFVSVFWLPKLRLPRENTAEDSLTEVLTAETSTTFHRSSSISHLLIRVNHWLQFLQVRIETDHHFAKKLLKFIVVIVGM